MNEMLAGGSTVVMAKEQLWCDLAGEVAILNLRNGVYYGLDPVGARIWNLIQTPRTVNEVRDTLVSEYDVDLDCCAQDLLALLQALAAEGLIEVKNEAAP